MQSIKVNHMAVARPFKIKLKPSSPLLSSSVTFGLSNSLYTAPSKLPT